MLEMLLRKEESILGKFASSKKFFAWFIKTFFVMAFISFFVFSGKHALKFFLALILAPTAKKYASVPAAFDTDVTENLYGRIKIIFEAAKAP